MVQLADRIEQRTTRAFGTMGRDPVKAGRWWLIEHAPSHQSRRFPGRFPCSFVLWIENQRS